MLTHVRCDADGIQEKRLAVDKKRMNISGTVDDFDKEPTDREIRVINHVEK